MSGTPRPSPPQRTKRSGPNQAEGRAVREPSRAFRINQRVARELRGLIVASLSGLVLAGLASYQGNDLDQLMSGASPHSLANWGGPTGAYVAHALLSALGLGAFAWALWGVAWGALIAVGRARLPRLHVLAGALLATIPAAGLLELSIPPLTSYESVGGNGGRLGGALASTLTSVAGQAGAFIGCLLLAVSALVISRALRLSRSQGHDAPAAPPELRAASAEDALPVPTPQGRADATMHVRSSEVSDVDRDAPRAVQHEADVAFSELSDSGSEFDEDAEVDLAGGALVGLPFDEAPPAFAFEASAQKHGKPSVELLPTGPASEPVETSVLDEMERALLAALEGFQLNAELVARTVGPLLVTFELRPGTGTKVAKFTSHASDLARMMKTDTLRVLPSIPGKDTVGVEVPRPQRETIAFATLVGDQSFKSRLLNLPVALGLDTLGAPVVRDLAEMPHVLVAGATGSGKSVFIHTLLSSLLFRLSAKELRLVLIDPKTVELAAYGNIPHLACPVIRDIERECLPALNGLVDEMEQRYARFAELGVRDLSGFNRTIKETRKGDHPKFTGKWKRLPSVVVVIDEYADLFAVLGKEAEAPIARLAQKARAAGIHIVLCTQRPSVNVVTGTLKANFPTRVAFRVQSGTDSRTILDKVGAESLLGRGDMLLSSTAGLERVHGAFLDDETVLAITRACR